MFILATWHFLMKSCFSDFFFLYNFVIQIFIPPPSAYPLSTQPASIFTCLSNDKISSLKAYSSQGLFISPLKQITGFAIKSLLAFRAVPQKSLWSSSYQGIHSGRALGKHLGCCTDNLANNALKQKGEQSPSTEVNLAITLS